MVSAQLRILIVDDSAPMRHFLAALMREHDASVQEAGNGEEALAFYASWHPDLVLMDIRMPGMDGIETTRRIKGRDPNAVVVMVTDYDSPVYRRDAIAAGARQYVLKRELGALEEAVRSAMDSLC